MTDKKEHTLLIVKPNAVRDNHIGEIISVFEKNGIVVCAAKMTRFTRGSAQEFYEEHKDRDFYGKLVDFMIETPVMVCVLEGKNVVKEARRLIGDTDPKTAAKGTIRHSFGENVTINAVHGSDSAEHAEREIDFFFESNEIYSR